MPRAGGQPGPEAGTATGTAAFNRGSTRGATATASESGSLPVSLSLGVLTVVLVPPVRRRVFFQSLNLELKLLPGRADSAAESDSQRRRSHRSQA